MVDKYLGEIPDEASKGFPQVSSDPDVNRTRNLVLSINLIYGLDVDVSAIA